MPDEEINPAPVTDDSNDDSGGQSAPSFAPDHDSDQSQPRPGESESPVRPEDLRKQYDEVHNGLNSVLNQQRVNQNDYYVFQKELDDLKKEEQKRAEMKPPVPYALPAPPDEYQKGNLATIATNLLKIAGLIAMSYGVSRIGRSSNRAASFENALGGALDGYYKGNNHRRDSQLQHWEKNRQFLMDQNRIQHQQYVDTVNTQNTNIRQKFDILKAQSQMWNNKRMQDAAIRQDMMAVQKTLTQEMKLQRDIETQLRRDRKDWYKAMGLAGLEGAKYRDWVKSKGGPDITDYLKAETSGAGLSDSEKDAMYQIEKDYPRDQMLKEEQAAKDKEAEDKSAKEAQQKSDIEFGRFKKEQEYKANPPSGTQDKNDPNAPISPDKAAQMRERIFGGGGSED